MPKYLVTWIEIHTRKGIVEADHEGDVIGMIETNYEPEHATTIAIEIDRVFPPRKIWAAPRKPEAAKSPSDGPQTDT